MRFFRFIANAYAYSHNRSKVFSHSTFSQRQQQYLHLHSLSEPPSFGIAFDIDGVILRGHSPIGGSPQALASLYHDSGKGEPAAVMTEYGFKNVLSIDEYASCFDNIDPLAQYKKWTAGQVDNQENTFKNYVCSQRVQAAFIVSDSVDWSRDIQLASEPWRDNPPRCQCEG